MDSLLYWLFFNNKKLKMRFVFNTLVHRASYIKSDLVNALNNYMSIDSHLDAVDKLPISFFATEYSTGFYYDLDGILICPRELSDVCIEAMQDLFAWHINRFVSIEDRADMLNDVPHLCESVFAHRLIQGNYNPFELYFLFFSTALNAKQFPVNQDDFN